MNTELTFLDYWRTVKNNLAKILVFTFLGTLVSAGISLLLPNIYQADTLIMVISAKQGGNPLTAVAGGWGSMLSQELGPMFSQKNDQLLAVLQSRTLSLSIIDKHRNALMDDLFPGLWDTQRNAWHTQDPLLIPQPLDIIEALNARVQFINENPQSSTIRMIAQARTPTLAKKLADSYVIELADYLKTNVLTTAKQNRIFLEQSLENKSKELLEAGKELSHFYETNVISKIGGLVDVDVGLQPHQVGKQVKEVPQQVYLRYLTERQDILATVASHLSASYEQAKIQENKEDISFQVVDPALLPTHKFKPNRKIIVAVTFVLLFAMSAATAMFYEQYRRFAKIHGDTPHNLDDDYTQRPK